MRKFLLAAVAVGAVAGASAVAQNRTPTTDKMNSSTTQNGAAMRSESERRDPTQGRHPGSAEGWAEFRHRCRTRTC